MIGSDDGKGMTDPALEFCPQLSNDFVAPQALTACTLKCLHCRRSSSTSVLVHGAILVGHCTKYYQQQSAYSGLLCDRGGAISLDVE